MNPKKGSMLFWSILILIIFVLVVISFSLYFVLKNDNEKQPVILKNIDNWNYQSTFVQRESSIKGIDPIIFDIKYVAPNSGALEGYAETNIYVFNTIEDRDTILKEYILSNKNFNFSEEYFSNIKVYTALLGNTGNKVFIWTKDWAFPARQDFLSA